MFKGIIFDLDGTLIDSINFWLDLYKRTAKKFGIEIDENELKKRFGERDVDILISLTPEDKRKEVVEYYYQLKKKEKYKVDLKKFDFVDEVLKKIREKGLKIGVATGNTRDIADFIITKNKIGRYIDFSAAHDDVERGKPAPDMLAKVQENLGVNKEEILCVGDGINDYKAARSFRVKVGLVLTGALDKEESKNLKPDYLLKDIKEVLEII